METWWLHNRSHHCHILAPRSKAKDKMSHGKAQPKPYHLFLHQLPLSPRIMFLAFSTRLCPAYSWGTILFAFALCPIQPSASHHLPLPTHVFVLHYVWRTLYLPWTMHLLTPLCFPPLNCELLRTHVYYALWSPLVIQDWMERQCRKVHTAVNHVAASTATSRGPHVNTNIVCACKSLGQKSSQSQE